MQSKDVRRRIKKAGLYQYEVAYEVGVNEATFIRWLRRPLNDEREASIQAAINTLIERRETVNNGKDEDNC